MTLEDIRREYFENRLGRAVGGRFAKERKELIDLLGYPPDLANIPPEFWNNGGAAMASKVQPILQDIAVESGIALQEAVVGSIVIDWTLTNQAAADWASTYTYNLVSELKNTSVKQMAAAQKQLMGMLQDTVPEFFTEALTRGELEKLLVERGLPDLEYYWKDKLIKIYAPQRAEMIAVTEVTRANYEGERLAVDEIRRSANIRMWPTWLTNRDDLVCAICSPLHGIPADRESGGVFYWTHPETGIEYAGPPAHVRCRCDAAYGFAEDMGK